MAKSSNLPVVLDDAERGGRIAQAITDFIAQIPASRVDSERGDPEAAAQRLASSAAQRAALTAGSLALPPGPLGWLTVLPELVAIWRIQGQLVSDIASVYGKHAELGREQMLWCLFRHTAAQAFRDLVIRVGDRMLFRRLSYGALPRLAQRIGIKISQRAVGKGLARWLPVVGALGVGAYAYYDTGQVAKTAIELFSGVIDVEATEVEASPPPKAAANVVATSTSAPAAAAENRTGAARPAQASATTSPSTKKSTAKKATGKRAGSKAVGTGARKAAKDGSSTQVKAKTVRRRPAKPSTKE